MENNNIVVQPVDKKKIKHLVNVALILFFVTVVEFIIAFTMASGGLRTTIFVVMSIVKAYYIVSEFMHLGHEVKPLRWSIIFPMILVLWLIVALIVEGGYVYVMRLFE